MGGVSRVLVVGGTGLLGQYLRAEAAARGHEVVATRREAAGTPLPGIWRGLELAQEPVVGELVREVRPDLVLNAAALTDVDGCERDPEAARTVNGRAAGWMAAAARDAGARFVHFSTDYVFDGSGPAAETTEPHPLNEYGRSKLEGEGLVRRADPKALILRLSAVFGWNRLSPKTNAATWILQKLEAGREATLFHDQRVTPTYAGTAAEAAFDLAAAGASGLFHVACRECLSRAEMGQAVAEVFRIPDPKIRPIAAGELKLLARRPQAPCLVTSKVEETLKRTMPTFRDCLEDMRATR